MLLAGMILLAPFQRADQGDRNTTQSAEFDDLAPRLKFGDDTRELNSKGLQQGLLPAIADPHPNQLAGPARNTGKEGKILVFANDDLVARICVPPDYRVIGFH